MLFLYSEVTALHENKQFNNKIFNFLKKKKIARRNINNLRYADDTTLRAESEELKSLLMKVKEESFSSWLKAQHSENEDDGVWFPITS